LSLTLREERRLRVLENRVLRRIFGPKKGKVAGEWGKLHNEEFNDLYCSPIIVRVKKLRRMRWVGHVALRGRGVYRDLVRKLEGKRSFGRPRRRCEDDIKMILQEVGSGGMDLIELAQGRGRWRALVNVIQSLLVPLHAWNFLTF